MLTCLQYLFMLTCLQPHTALAFQQAVHRVGKEITTAFKATATEESFMVVGLLTGTFMFFADLVRVRPHVPHVQHVQMLCRRTSTCCVEEVGLGGCACECVRVRVRACVGAFCVFCSHSSRGPTMLCVLLCVVGSWWRRRCCAVVDRCRPALALTCTLRSHGGVAYSHSFPRTAPQPLPGCHHGCFDSSSTFRTWSISLPQALTVRVHVRRWLRFSLSSLASYTGCVYG